MRKVSELSPAELFQLDNDFFAIVEIVQNGKPQKEFKEVQKLLWWALAVVAASVALLVKCVVTGEYFSVTFVGALGLFALATHTTYAVRKRLKLLAEEMGLRFPHYRGSQRDADQHNHLIAQLELKFDADLEKLFIHDIGGTPISLPKRFSIPAGMVARPYVYSHDPYLVLAMVSPPY